MTGVEIALSGCNLLATAFAAYAAWRSAKAGEESTKAANKSVLVAEASAKAGERSVEIAESAERSAKRNVEIAESAERSAEKSAEAAKEQVGVALMQKELAQRQFIIPLWDRMAGLKPIDPRDPAPVDVHAAVNTMELVGLCCEGGMIDPAVIKRTFKDRYVELYDMVKACGKIATMRDKSGADLLRENKAATQFYNELMAEITSEGQLKRT